MPPVPAPPAVPLCVLVADDDADMRLYLRGCLLALGVARVVEAADGLTALRLAHDPEVALVVTDRFMPGLDGEALCQALRADAETAAVPVLLVSGEPSGGEMRDGMSARPTTCADGFLAKPFNAAGLRLAVERLFAPVA